MSETQSAGVTADSYEIRTLGEAGSAAAGLPTRQRILLGFDLSNDIVVRHPSIRGCQIAIFRSDGVAVVELLSGQATLLGQTLAAPCQLILPPYVPLNLGEVAIAYGEAAAAQWERAASLLKAIQGMGPVRTVETPARRKLLARFVSGCRRFSLVAVIASTLSLLAVGVGAAAYGGLLSAVAPSPDPAALQLQLTKAGFTALSVQHRPRGGIIIAGFLPSDLAAARLNAFLLQQNVRATLAIRTADGAAREVEDAFNSNGVRATVRATSPGEVAVAVPAGTNPLRLDKAVRAAQIATGIRSLRIETTAHVAGSETPDVHITEAIDGADGFVATADGDRYFVGAQLPTGQSIVAIHPHVLELEAGGLKSQLSF